MEPLSFQGQGLLTVHTTWQTPPAQNSVALPHHCFCVLCASLARFWGMSHRCRYKWLTDSKAAISKVTFIIQSSSRPRRYPDNIDLDTAIRELHQSLGGRKMKIKWVRGHQDDRTPYEELPSEAKLNIDSDSLASDHYWSGRGQKPIETIPHFPEFQVSILINGIRYPSKIDQQLRYHINGSYLKNHLQRRYRWNEKVWHLIDFTNFGRFFAKLSISKQVQHMKFVHSLEPIGEQKQRFASHSTSSEYASCPCCRTEIETQLHLLQCRSNRKRKQALVNFAKTDKIRGGNPYEKIIVDLVVQWMTAPDHIPTFEKCRDTFLRHDVIPVAYTSLINRAIMEQTSIGWMHAMQGFLSKTWTTVASSSYTHHCAQIEHTPDGNQRIHKTLTALHRLTTDIWSGQNDMLHEKQVAQEADIIRTTVAAEISKFHREPDLMLAVDTHYSEQSLKMLLRSSVSTKRRWLHRVKLSRMKKAAMIARQPRITKFFQKDPPIDTNRNTDMASDHMTPQTTTTSRNKTTQQLLTQFFRERAPNPPNNQAPPLRPSPLHVHLD